MPKGKPLSVEQRERIYDLYTMGVPQADIAEQFGVSVPTVSRSVSTQRKLREGKRVQKVAEIVVGGDKKNGRLVSLGKDRFEGTCLVGGKMKRRTFSAANSRNAKQQWEKWCVTLRDEQAFIDMVERQPRHEADEHDVVYADGPTAVCGAPLDPIEEIRSTTKVAYEKPAIIDPTDIKAPEIATAEAVDTATASDTDGGPWRSVAVERLQEIEQLKARIAELEGGAKEPAYAIWAKSESPRFYGLFSSMDKALNEVDRLNDVAKFLGQGGVFEVEEVAWRG